MARDYKSINVCLDVWELASDACAVTGEPMKEIAEEAIKMYIRDNKPLREKIEAYRVLVKKDKIGLLK